MINPHIHVPFDRIEGHLVFIKENRVNIEIYFDSRTLDAIDNSYVLRLIEKLDYNPSLSIHAPFMDLSPGAVDTKVRAVTIERFTRVLEIAEILKSHTVVFHSGYEKWKYALNVDLWLEKSLKTWTLIQEKAGAIGTKIAIENIFEDDPVNLRRLMEEMGSESFGICFDTGHFNLFSRIPLNEWLSHLNPYIIELHLHDNNRTFDDHFAIGDGSFDFDMLFSSLKGKSLIYTIEAHTAEDVLKSLVRLKKYI
ncbi:MAG: sugar phosphate isomerase/epimerase [Nitrospirae bacterium]|nr:sugar phosphate isomerase/epimerase [Nitrospirota bacterium]